MKLNRITILPEKRALILAAIAAVLVTIVVAVAGAGRPKASSEARAGRKYVAEAVSLDTAPVDEVIEARRSDRLAAKAEEAVESGAIWGMFKDYVVMGDSRAVGFYYHDFLDESRVFADGGHTIRNITDNLQAVKELAPSYIYICYGLNDTGVGYWKNGVEYASEFAKHIDELRDAAPNATIVVSSILPATPEAVAVNDVWEAIPEFSAAAEKMCKEKGVIFVNNDDLAKRYMDTLWDADGVHLRPEFYPLWAQRLLSAAMGVNGGAQ